MLSRPPLDPEDPPPSCPVPRALLVVEDDADHRAIVQDILEDEGYRVDTAVHGQDALARLTSMVGGLPDLILLDMLMPVMDGWAFMAALKERPLLARIPVLVTSCGGDRVLSSAPVAAGYLAKPLDRSRLLETICGCLWRRQRSDGGSRPARVLFVHDQSTIGVTVARLLARDHEIMVAVDAADAIARIGAGEAFDMILCDLDMPGMTGMDLHARLIRDAPAEASRMVFLAHAELTAEARSFLQHVRPRSIEKPFTVTALRSLIERLVDPARA
jgi:CheY-like chemotaxis protein